MVIKGFSEKIQDRMSVLGWSRAFFAEKLGLSEKSLQRMLDSEDIKKLDSFVQICKYLGFSPLHILADEILQHAFVEYFDIIYPNDEDGHLVELIFEQNGQPKKQHLIFTQGVGGEYFAERKADDFKEVSLAYPDRYSQDFKELKGLKVAQLTEDTPELELQKNDFVLAINQPQLNYSYIKYMRYGIGHVLAAYFKEDGSTDYGILKSIDGKSLSFKSAMKVEDNTLVFVDEKTYFHWLRVELPQSPYSLEAFQSKIFHSINLLQEDKFKLYPVVAFVKNLTQRIAGDLLKEMEELKEQLGKG